MLLQNTDNQFIGDCLLCQLCILCLAPCHSDIWFVIATSRGLFCQNASYIISLKTPVQILFCFLFPVCAYKSSFSSGAHTNYIFDSQLCEQRLALSLSAPHLLSRAPCHIYFPESKVVKWLACQFMWWGQLECFPYAKTTQLKVLLSLTPNGCKFNHLSSLWLLLLNKQKIYFLHQQQLNDFPDLWCET